MLCFLLKPPERGELVPAGATLALLSQAHSPAVLWSQLFHLPIFDQYHLIKP